MTSTATRAYMTLMAIAQHHGRPHTPTDQAWIESFFGHIKHEWPHLNTISDPEQLDTELARIRVEYNTVRLHEAIGYVTPDDEHHRRGEHIREARRQGLRRARQQRLDHNRQTTTTTPENTPQPVNYQPNLRGRLRHTSPSGGPPLAPTRADLADPPLAPLGTTHLGGPCRRR